MRLRKRRVIAVIASGEKPVFRVRTAMGHEIVATAEHPFMTAAGWRKLSALRVRDRVAAARSLPVRRDRRVSRNKALELAEAVVEGCVPPEVFSLSDATIASFLACLWEGRGGSRKFGVSYTTASRRLASEIQHLLLRLDIVAQLRRRSRAGHYVVTVAGEDSLRRFWRFIGSRFQKPERQHPEGSKRRLPLSDEVLHVASPDIHWDEIVSIESVGKRPTYDLQIEGDHNFLANNLVVHNSHAASFALLVYDSAWLKCFEPAAFTCALLNSLPMGFYAPAQLVRDAREHDVEVRPVRVEASFYESTLERREDGAPALRLGMRLVKSLSEAGAKRLEAARSVHPFESVQDLVERAKLDRADLEALAAADALASLSGNRHLAFWEVAGTERSLPLAPRSTRTADDEEGRPLLTAPTDWQSVVADYNSVGLTLNAHPLKLLRERLQQERVLRSTDLQEARNGALVRVAGVVLMRQHPASARGVTFMTIEDETGIVNIVVWQRVAEEQRRPFLESRLLEVRGELQRQHGVTHVIARQLVDRSGLIGELLAASRDFH